MSNNKFSGQCTLEQARVCAKCETAASMMEEPPPSDQFDFKHGEVYLIKCANSACKERPWFHCKSCSKRFRQLPGYKGLENHWKNKHKQERAPPPPDPPATIAPNANKDNGHGRAHATDEAGVPQDGSTELMAIEKIATISEQLAAVPMEVAPSSAAETKTIANLNAVVNLEGNEWLVKALKDTSRATHEEVIAAFERPEVQHMQRFWAAEHSCGEGRCGGGLSLLVGKAFQQATENKMDESLLPTFPEAHWHICKMTQYQSMNEAQRVRQAWLDDQLRKIIPPGVFFNQSSLVGYEGLNRHYGSSGKCSLWNNLPCPEPREIGGVAYVSPRAIITFAMANGVPIDDITVNSDNVSEMIPFNEAATVDYVRQCRKVHDWLNKIKQDYYVYGSNGGAPNAANSNSGAPKKEPVVICVVVSDWMDGFGPDAVKNNRNSIECKSFTMGSPEHMINATDNTFAVALGLKKAPGWREVERLFLEDLESLCSTTEPTRLYHGVLQKMVPCFFIRSVVICDKFGKPFLTGTMAFGSDVHRCYGVSGKMETPHCDVRKIAAHFKKQLDGKGKGEFGWSEPYIDKKAKRNGAFFPACLNCRKVGLMKLGFEFSKGQEDLCKDESLCKECHNWDMLPKNGSLAVPLDFPAHDDYPTSITEGSPVPAPKGRDVFEEGARLPFVQLDWSLLVEACKFAFYQVCVGKWNKGQTKCYLSTCGVQTELAATMYDIAKECKKAKEENEVQYDEDTGIFGFKFPGSWQSIQISILDYIEAIMHILFLGIAKSQWELQAKWFTDTPAGAKVSNSGFLNVLQTLIKDLRVLNLSWLPAYPLTGQKGKLGTGSWVAENWITLVRVSQFVFGYLAANHKAASRHGADDVSRTVIALHAFVARCMTHSGINGNFIKDTECYLKEFLSTVRELDVRLHYKKLNRAKDNTERTSSEAWWMKSNYMSLCNLLSMMALLGPLVLWWDGGGKGEKFVQVVKPHIKRGVREDVSTFFSNLMKNVYKALQLNLFEKRYNTSMDDLNPMDDSMLDILNGLSEFVLNDADDGTKEATDGNAYTPTDAFFSPKEIHGMTKKNTIFLYRNPSKFQEAIAPTKWKAQPEPKKGKKKDDNNGDKPVRPKPLPGIVKVSKSDDAQGTQFEFQVLYRKPVSQFARRRVTFDDNKGILFHGLWCAPLTVEESESVPPTQSFSDIQSDAGYSAVALPLWYLLGDHHKDSNKYCVITNWWHYRMQDGSYKLPTLEPTLYKTRAGGDVTWGNFEEDGEIEFPMEATSGEPDDKLQSIRI